MAQHVLSATYVGVYSLTTHNSTNWKALTSADFHCVMSDMETDLPANRSLAWVQFKPTSDTLTWCLFGADAADLTTDRDTVASGAVLTMDTTGQKPANGVSTAGTVAFKKTGAGDAGVILAGFN